MSTIGKYQSSIGKIWLFGIVTNSEKKGTEVLVAKTTQENLDDHWGKYHMITGITFAYLSF